jgi:spermidine synthase
MSETTLLTPGSTTQAPERAVLAGVALSSFAALLLELTLTRLFSVVLFYHFAFLAISIALLGLGAGGVFAHLKKDWLERFEIRPLVARLCAINCLVVPVVLAIVLRIPVSLEISKANFLRLTLIYLASAVPFLITGLEFSVVFARQTRHVSPLYAADLGGGALACLAIVPLLNWLGGPNTVLFAGACMGIAGMVWAEDRKGRKGAAARAVFLLVLIAVNYSGKFFDIVYAKGGFRDAAWVEFARWNAISRVEVDRQGDARAIVIDADASTYLMNVDPKKNWKGTEWEEHLMAAPPSLANVLRPRGDFAIIGPGGGVDVVRALASGSPSVTGIEINPIIANTIMRGRYADYVYHLYERPEVHIHVTDGRSFVRNSSQQFDVVQMTLVDTWASTAAGAFALSENSLYTVEAFREYFEHLKPDGMVAITRWEFQQPREALRVVSVAMQALHELGVADTRGNFIVVSEGSLNKDGIAVVVLAKRSPFTAEEQARVRAHVAANPRLFLLYPSGNKDLVTVTGEEDHYPATGESFTRLIQLNDPHRFAARYPYDVSPVTDNAPFFFFNLKLGQVLRPGSLQQGMDWKVNLGVAVLGMVLAISLLAVLGFLVVPLAVGARSQQPRPVRLLYFVAVGLGYILVEIAFIQRFVLFLGHPVYALTVVVFLLLLSSGAGSMASRWWLREAQRPWLPLLLIAGALLVYVAILPGLLNRLVGLPFAAKLLVSGVLLIPLGFAMGMPFPAGLRALALRNSGEFPGVPENTSGGNLVEWAWAMNAASSVLGSVVAIIIAIQFGLNATLASGAAAYLLALALTATLRPVSKEA